MAARELLTKASATMRGEGLGATARKAARYGLKPLRARAAVGRLQRESTGLPPGELYDYVRSFDHHGIDVNAFQLRSEIAGLLELLAENPPGGVVEIGTASGGTLFMLTRVARDDAVIVSVDLPGGVLGDQLIKRSSAYPRWRSKMYEGFGLPGQTMHVLRANSQTEATRDAVGALLGDRALDFLLIDGDHSFAGVSRDFELYAPLVAPGGLVAFHDIVPGGPGKHGDPGGVPQFWQQVKATHGDARELVEDWEWGSCGIGVVTV